MTGFDRRNFLRRSITIAGGAVLTPTALEGLVARAAMAAPGGNQGSPQAGLGEGGYGPLAPAGPELMLPEGFTYRKFGVEGTLMTDGNPTPRAHDGMATFPLANGNVRLIRNHEDRDVASVAMVKGDPARAYDPKGGGGTTSLEVKIEREAAGKVTGVVLVKDFISLNGTIVNCAGGPTPWGTWITCEETTVGEAQGWTTDHGYTFEVAATAEAEVTPVPLKAMGRFVHEAVAVDAKTGIVYETEDFRYQEGNNSRPGAGFYRYIPHTPGNLVLGGRLQILAVKGRSNYNTVTGQRIGKPLPVTWIDITDPDPAAAETDPSAVFRQGLAGGAAIFQRLEGCWYDNGSIFFHATSGGDAGLGQVWEYRPLDRACGNAGGLLTLLFESPSAEILDAPDNITVSPRGGLVLCEDGGGVQYLRGLTPRGKIFDFALNTAHEGEFAGACFSPDGQVLFANIMGDTSSSGPGDIAMTFAIWGPWEQGAL